MPEFTPAEPFASDHMREWCDWHGVDDEMFRSLSHSGFKIAREQNRDTSIAFQLRQEIERALPLEGCHLVRHPEATPTGRKRPKVYEAPDGFAFEITTQEKYYPHNEFGELIDGEPKIVDYRFVGEFLEIETSATRGKAAGSLIVRERPLYKAAPILNYGGGWDGPDEDAMLKFPSKYDPSKVGDRVAFVKHDGWDVYTVGKKLEGSYDRSAVRLVPYQKREEEFFVANFGAKEQFPLDDFTHFTESPLLPPGYVCIPISKGEIKIVPTLGQLILPPLDRNYWTELWERHGIMIKYNPTADDQRVIHLRANSRVDLDFEIRKINRRERVGSTFMRVIAVHDSPVCNSLDNLVRAFDSEEELSEEEIKRFGQF